MITRLSFAAAGAILLASTPARSQVVLNIDQSTGAVEIANTSDTATVNINGYAVRSPQDSGAADDGLLDSTGWADLETNVGGGWLATSFASSELLLETNANSVLSLGPGAVQSLGSAFTTDAARIGAAQTLAGFGSEYRDVTFEYTDADNGSTQVNGAVNYSNTIFNDLVLSVDIGTGMVELVNESAVAVTIAEYTIRSDAGSLDTGWNGLRDTVTTWVTNDLSRTDVLSELSPPDATIGSPPGRLLDPLTINGGDSYDLGGAFTVGGAQDLVFNFTFATEEDGIGDTDTGVVRYVGAAGLVGDYNSDNVVDAADYTVWRDNLGTSFALPNRDPANTGDVGTDDYNSWRSNYGASNSGGLIAFSAAPEPSSVALLLSLTCVGLARVRW